MDGPGEPRTQKRKRVDARPGRRRPMCSQRTAISAAPGSAQAHHRAAWRNNHHGAAGLTSTPWTCAAPTAAPHEVKGLVAHLADEAAVAMPWWCAVCMRLWTSSPAGSAIGTTKSPPSWQRRCSRQPWNGRMATGPAVLDYAQGHRPLVQSADRRRRSRITPASSVRSNTEMTQRAVGQPSCRTEVRPGCGPFRLHCRPPTHPAHNT